MSMSHPTAAEVSDCEIVSTRLIPYAPAQVYEAFQNPELLARWWGPEGFTNTFETFDLQPGGVWKFVMHGPDGTDYPNENVFSEIVENHRVVFDHIFAPVFQMTITFDATDEPNQTLFGFRMRFETPEMCQKIKAICGPANEQNFDRLEAVLAGKSLG